MPASRTAAAEPARLPPIDGLNRLDRAAFTRALRALFERAPALIERLWGRRPFRAYPELLASAREEIAGMSEAERVAILDAHPRIGQRGGLSARSAREQGGAAPDDVERALADLNDRYERRFGFRLVVFVAGRPKAELVEVLRARLARERDEELRTGIAEFLAIAADRAAKLA